MSPWFAAAALAVSTGLTAASFRRIVEAHRRRDGVPIPASLLFAAAALAGVLALHALRAC